VDLDHWTTIVVAAIGAIALIATGWLSYLGARRVKTSNGQTSGQLLEFIAEEISWLRISHTEHVKDQEIHRTQVSQDIERRDG
jgi:hypothetical protein